MRTRFLHESSAEGTETGQEHPKGPEDQEWLQNLIVVHRKRIEFSFERGFFLFVKKFEFYELSPIVRRCVFLFFLFVISNTGTFMLSFDFWTPLFS